VRQALQELVKSHAIRSMTDIPRGDFNLMQTLDLRLKDVGADTVEELVLANQKYGASDKMFVPLNLVADEHPRADAVLCRDCLFLFSTPSPSTRPSRGVRAQRPLSGDT
jgi:hypothetical protein